VLEQILDGSDLSVSEARNLLGRFLFSGDDIYKVTGALSGGELARVALANLTMHGANFLLLDEPTTHLDIDSQEILQDVLQQFNGTILFISHDRYLIDALASDVWYVQDRGLSQFEGNYSAWLVDRQRRTETATSAAAETTRGNSDEQRRAQRQQQTAERRRPAQLEELEAAIEALERRLEATIRLLDEASAAQDAGRVHELGSEYERTQRELEAQIHAWERLAGGAEEA
jgi:ATP-binding cassette subfamily F protein 3